MLDRAKFTAALQAAEAAALKSIAAGGGDGGSCNFDTPYVVVPAGTRKATIEACAAKAGVRVYPHYTAPSRWMVAVSTGGQGMARTRAAEAARTAIQKAGFDASVYYAVD